MQRIILLFSLTLAIPVLFCRTSLAQELDKARRASGVIVVSPMIGRGTYDDPRRPAAVRVMKEKGDGQVDRVSFRYLPSDDGRMAIVEISGATGAAITALKAAPDLAETVIERGKFSKEEIENVLKRVKKDFRWEDLAGVEMPVEVKK